MNGPHREIHFIPVFSRLYGPLWSVGRTLARTLAFLLPRKSTYRGAMTNDKAVEKITPTAELLGEFVRVPTSQSQLFN